MSATTLRSKRRQEQIQRRRAQRKLRQRQKAEGLEPFPTATISNGTSEWATIDEEKQARQEAVEEQLRVYRTVLPVLLKRLEKIPDPRNPKTIQHKSTVLMLYGILSFVFQMASRREANREMTMPQFQENLKLLFPELESVPHQDTLNRLLANIPVDQIQDTLVELIQHFIRNKKFYRYLVSHDYPIAIDGTQKQVRNLCWAEECLQRHVQHKEKNGTVTIRPQYYVYVLEANFAFPNGMTIPLMSEFLSGTETDPASSKQDCELKAFKRLAQRIRERFPRLPIQVLLDGLYPSGPVLELCRRYHWQFMIVLQDDSLPSVWEEVRGLEKLQKQNRFERNWGDRRQRFRWVNDLEYRYGPNERKRQTIHVVICEERWEEIDADARIVEKTSRHAWISSQPLSRSNVHELCNLGARHRWAIESSILVEKRHGYQYEHCFSKNWEAMRGYHFLMRLGHLINILAQKTERLAQIARKRGLRGLIQFIRDTCKGPWLDADRIRQLHASSLQLRLE
ncbi:MAG TPA: transposase family protein [Terriglobales bacterium]|nr:transposase family protein [Terriglobales bacterium]